MQPTAPSALAAVPIRYLFGAPRALVRRHPRRIPNDRRSVEAEMSPTNNYRHTMPAAETKNDSPGRNSRDLFRHCGYPGSPAESSPDAFRGCWWITAKSTLRSARFTDAG